MQEIEFNLLTEPWVRVRLPDNTVPRCTGSAKTGQV